jgi:membrane associated rhomboid family serine protease
MLMPGLSVTLIGLVIAAIAIARGKPALPVLLRGLVGAWVGFVGLALIGLVVDVLFFSGMYVAILGHIGAAMGAAIAVARARERQYI